ncbi:MULTISPECIES: LysR family transcriptional regulator [unclassified Pseudomonas]|uniref:LysR family transcriptional regulator n=1 Tax=unclassified Pseudomonas TaxID=196821 RepID=UPI001C474588|nr:MULTISPECIES: LysR family transcriptional regulator [unclassified Pseudomonas]MCU1738507.1 LysR family transcriptional regulator [Pseudomonas sp. 20S_6.2_Bac1]
MSFDGRLLSNISVLAAIVHSGSFARAAEALGMSPSGISRAVGRLESSIGVRLFDRTTRSVTLTDEGRRLYGEISPLLSGIGDAVNLASGASTAVRGRLRVNVDAYFSRRMLAPQLATFLDLYPELSLELIVRDQLGDLVAEGFDIAVRFGQVMELSRRWKGHWPRGDSCPLGCSHPTIETIREARQNIQPAIRVV